MHRLVLLIGFLFVLANANIYSIYRSYYPFDSELQLVDTSTGGLTNVAWIWEVEYIGDFNYVADSENKTIFFIAAALETKTTGLGIIDLSSGAAQISKIEFSDFVYPYNLLLWNGGIIGVNSNNLILISTTNAQITEFINFNVNYSFSGGVIVQDTLYIVGQSEINYNTYLLTIDLMSKNVNISRIKSWFIPIDWNPQVSKLIGFVDSGNGNQASLMDPVSLDVRIFNAKVNIEIDVYGDIINSQPCDVRSSYAIDPTSNTFYTVCNLYTNPQFVSVDIPSGKVMSTLPFSNPSPSFDPLLCYLPS